MAFMFRRVDREFVNRKSADTPKVFPISVFSPYYLRHPKMTRSLIIINNAAAKTRIVWPKVRQQLIDAAVEFDIHETAHAGDATRHTRAALKAGVTSVAVLGGDGTLSEAAEGFFEFSKSGVELPAPINSTASLAILPAGTGDDFARGLMGQFGARADLTQCVDIFISHHHRRNSEATTLAVDVLFGLCDNFKTPFICLNASTMGIGGETAARVAAQGSAMRKLSGEARFAVAAIQTLAAWRERRVRVTVDDREVIEGQMNLAAVANALYAGGGMMLSPHARFDDGKLDVVTACGLNRAQVIRELLRIHKGGHISNPKVRITQGTKVRVETFSTENAMRIEADGNVRGLTPVEFRLLPAALNFVTTTR
jgi:YegS/Rv2252/BmrU family lipid kinase